MLGSKVSKIFRRNSSKKSKDKGQPRTLRQRSSLGTIQESLGEYGSIHEYPRDVDGARPVPPPSRFHGSHEGFIHPEDELHDHNTRLYEGFTPSENGLARGATTVPSVARHGEYEDYPEDAYHHGSYAGDAHTHHETFADELGYVPTHGEHGEHEAIHIARSSSSHTGSQRSIRERGLGPARTQTAKTMGVSRSASSAAGYGRTYPIRSHRRQYSDPVHRPLAAPIKDYYEPRLPYLIFCDFGNGLEIGNEEDGFMSYQQYVDTAHFRRDHKHTYYIIPGNTPVVFHDENNKEMFRVDAHKYNTPTLRRRKYIIQDETGKELFRIGNWGKRESQHGLLGALGGDSHSSHKGPKVVYLNSSDTSNGSHKSSPRYHSSSSLEPASASRRDAVRPAYTVTRSPVRRPELVDDVLTESSGSSVPEIVITDEGGDLIVESPRSIHKSPLLHSPRSRYANELMERDEGYFIDNEDRVFADVREAPDTRGTNLKVYRVNTSNAGGSEASYSSGSRRRSPVIRM